MKVFVDAHDMKLRRADPDYAEASMDALLMSMSMGTA
jgi:hypothetical protein